MPQFLGSPLVIVVFAAIMLVAIGIPLWRMLMIYSGTSTRRQFDASGLGLQPPPDLLPVIAALLRLGFQRLGEAQVDLPGTRAVELTATAHPRTSGEHPTRHTIFVFVDGDGTVTAETGQVPGVPILVGFSSHFADGTVVETMHPRGESIHDADFHSGYNNVSLDRAYDDQRLEMNRWRMRHGAPRAVASMAEYLRDDAAYRERYARRKLRGPLLRQQLLPAAAAVIAVVALAVWALSR